MKLSLSTREQAQSHKQALEKLNRLRPMFHSP